MKVSFFWDKYCVWVDYPNADKVLTITGKEWELLSKWCIIDIDWNITETQEYLDILNKEKKESIKKSISNDKYQYEIDSILLEMVKAIYDVMPATMQNTIPIEIKTKYNQLKNFLDWKII